MEFEHKVTLSGRPDFFLTGVTDLVVSDRPAGSVLYTTSRFGGGDLLAYRIGADGGLTQLDSRAIAGSTQSGSVNKLTLVGDSLYLTGVQNAAKRFRTSIIELNSLLQLSGGRQSHPLSNRLDIGYDIALFHGARILDTVELGEGYSLMPYSHLREHVDDEWLEDVAPDQLRHRNWDSICAVVHHFRWKPEIRPPNSHNASSARRMSPSLDGRVSDFANLLSVSTGMAHRWMMTIEGCVPRASSDLLGLIHNCGSKRKSRSIGHLFGPFREPPIVDPELIEYARQHVFETGVRAYAELAPVIQRLAEALVRDGRYAREDKILDVAVSLERLFKPTGRGISLDLQNAIAETLGTSDESKAQLRDQVKHFYDVRSAIIHGPVDTKKKQLLTETGEAFQNGFELARASLMKKLQMELL